MSDYFSNSWEQRFFYKLLNEYFLYISFICKRHSWNLEQYVAIIMDTLYNDDTPLPDNWDKEFDKQARDLKESNKFQLYILQMYCGKNMVEGQLQVYKYMSEFYELLQMQEGLVSKPYHRSHHFFRPCSKGVEFKGRAKKKPINFGMDIKT